MGVISKAQVTERFFQDGVNSSHFIWLVGQFEFYETFRGWVFAYVKVGRLTLIALEPMVSPGEMNYHHFSSQFSEFQTETKSTTCAFVAINEVFREQLVASGFYGMEIGQEPWLNLANYQPRGNAAKGVRAARNQAVRAGVCVSEWKFEKSNVDANREASLIDDAKVRTEIDDIHREWLNITLFQFTDFLMASDPHLHSEKRRYFIAKKGDRIEGCLIATPIPAKRSYFFEDLYFRSTIARGVTELLVLQAIETLKSEGVEAVSLGIVSMVNLKEDRVAPPASSLVKALPFLRKISKAFYNAGGIDLFRKRFRPDSYLPVYLFINDRSGFVWFQAALAISKAHKTRLRFSGQWLRTLLTRVWVKYPITLTVSTLLVGSFYFFNHWGKLPLGALSRFGFSPSAPWYEWPLRSVVSDFLFFDRNHFLFLIVPTVLLYRWAERTFSRRFVLLLVGTTIVLDDFIDYFLVLLPFRFFQESLYRKVIANLDVGHSLILMTLVGLRINRISHLRELLFAAISVALIMGLALSSPGMSTFVQALDHFLYFAVGYLVGKVLFEYHRKQSRKVAKNRTPQAHKF